MIPEVISCGSCTPTKIVRGIKLLQIINNFPSGCTPTKIVRGIKLRNSVSFGTKYCTPAKIVRDIKRLLF